MNHDAVRPNVKAEVVTRASTAVYRNKLNGDDKLHDLHKFDEKLSNGMRRGRANKNTEALRHESHNFQIVMSSIHDIKEGEELCFDYGPLYTTAENW